MKVTIYGTLPPRTLILSTIETPLGPLAAASRDDGICLLEYARPGRLETQMATLRRHFGDHIASGDSPYLAQLRNELEAYFAGALKVFAVPLVVAGTPFQERVWAALQTIPYGQTSSYEALAETVAARGAQRAVGHANGQNRIAIVIPCHRVINKSGKLGGYGGELWRKEALLRLERGERLLL